MQSRKESAQDALMAWAQSSAAASAAIPMPMPAVPTRPPKSNSSSSKDSTATKVADSKGRTPARNLKEIYKAGRNAMQQGRTASTSIGRRDSVSNSHSTDGDLSVLTKFRVENPSMSLGMLQNLLIGYQTYTIDEVDGLLRDNPMSGRCATFGVVQSNSRVKTSQSGNKYANVEISDLCGNQLKLLLFRENTGLAEKLGAGQLCCIRNPQYLPDRTTGASAKSVVSVTVDDVNLVTCLGRCPDFAICHGKTRSGSRCTMAVNQSRSHYCKFHHAQASAAARKLEQKTKQTTKRKKAPERPITLTPMLLPSARGSVKRARPGSTDRVHNLTSVAPTKRHPNSDPPRASSSSLSNIVESKSALTQNLKGGRSVGVLAFDRLSSANEIRKQAVPCGPFDVAARKVKQRDAGEAFRKQFHLQSSANRPKFGKTKPPQTKDINNPDPLGRLLLRKDDKSKRPRAAMNANEDENSAAPVGENEVPFVYSSAFHGKLKEKVAEQKAFEEVQRAGEERPEAVRAEALIKQKEIKFRLEHRYQEQKGTRGAETLTSAQVRGPQGEWHRFLNPVQTSDIPHQTSAMQTHIVEVEEQKVHDILNRKSAFAQMENEQWYSDNAKKIKRMHEEADAAEEDAAEVTSIKVSAFQCKECKVTVERLHSFCKKKGHRVRKVEIMKHFFACRTCGNVVDVLGNALKGLAGACSRCGRHDLVRCGINGAGKPSVRRNRKYLPVQAEGFAMSDRLRS